MTIAFLILFAVHFFEYSSVNAFISLEIHETDLKYYGLPRERLQSSPTQSPVIDLSNSPTETPTAFPTATPTAAPTKSPAGPRRRLLSTLPSDYNSDPVTAMAYDEKNGYMYAFNKGKFENKSLMIMDLHHPFPGKENTNHWEYKHDSLDKIIPPLMKVEGQSSWQVDDILYYFDATNNYQFYSYNFVTHTRKLEGSPNVLRGACMVYYKIYHALLVVGGYTTGSSILAANHLNTKMYIFRIGSNRGWEEIWDFGKVGGKLPPLAFHGCALDSTAENLYLFGGESWDNATKTFVKNPSIFYANIATFDKTANEVKRIGMGEIGTDDLVSDISHLHCMLYEQNVKIYCVGGMNSDGSADGHVFEFNPSTSELSNAVLPTTERIGSQLVQWGKCFFIIGGYSLEDHISGSYQIPATFVRTMYASTVPVKDRCKWFPAVIPMKFYELISKPAIKNDIAVLNDDDKEWWFIDSKIWKWIAFASSGFIAFMGAVFWMNHLCVQSQQSNQKKRSKKRRKAKKRRYKKRKLISNCSDSDSSTVFSSSSSASSISK